MILLPLDNLNYYKFHSVSINESTTCTLIQVLPDYAGLEFLFYKPRNNNRLLVLSVPESTIIWVGDALVLV